MRFDIFLSNFKKKRLLHTNEMYVWGTELPAIEPANNTLIPSRVRPLIEGPPPVHLTPVLDEVSAFCGTFGTVNWVLLGKWLQDSVIERATGHGKDCS